MNYCGQLTPNLMRVCLADTDLQSVGGRVSLRHGLEQKSPAVELGSSCGSKEKGMVSGAATTSAVRSLLVTLNNLVDEMNALVSIPKADKTYEQLLEITYAWKKLCEETKEDLEKANARIVEITAETRNLLREHIRSLQESAAAVKRHDENMKALKKEIDELRREQTSNKVGGD